MKSKQTGNQRLVFVPQAKNNLGHEGLRSVERLDLPSANSFVRIEFEFCSPKCNINNFLVGIDRSIISKFITFYEATDLTIVITSRKSPAAIVNWDLLGRRSV